MLVDAGLLVRKDSANGKRYARRDGAGDVNEAFGFSLAPLLARSEEIEAIANDVIAERAEFHRLKERLTICRRDIAKLIVTAMEEQIAGDWDAIHLDFRALVDSVPRSPTSLQVAEILDAMERMREDVVNRLEIQLKTNNHSGNPDQNERHIQNTKPDSTTESEPRFEKKQGAISSSDGDAVSAVTEADLETRALPRTRPANEDVAGAIRSFPLAMVLQACPEIADYGPSGGIANWRDLMGAAVVVRSMLGVSPSAYQEACEVLGPENAATVMACILARTGQINSAGGYLRGLTERARKGEFALGPMLMALMRANAGQGRKAG